MISMAVHDGRYLGISEVAESTGFSLDTLRWYEREGLFPGWNGTQAIAAATARVMSR